MWLISPAWYDACVAVAAIRSRVGPRSPRFAGRGVAGSISLTAVSAVPDGTVLAVGYRDGPRGRTTFAIRGTTCMET